MAGLAEQFQRGGMGDVMSSWIGKGENLPIGPDALGGVLGGDILGQLTQRTGMNQGDILGQLSQMLPQMVDRATPEGQIPDGGLGDIGAILARFGEPQRWLRCTRASRDVRRAEPATMSKRNSRHSIGPFHSGTRRLSLRRISDGSFISGVSTQAVQPG